MKKPEHLGSVPINAGTAKGKEFGGTMVRGKFVPNATADMVREVDPTGAIVSHPVRRSGYVHERLHSMSGPQKLADELYDAAEKFRMDFERAGMAGNYARMDLFKTRSGQTEMTDKVAVAKVRIAKALKELGNGKDEPSLSQSVVWNVVGLGITLEEWTNLVRASGKGMNADKASGIFHVSLERLALHFGMVDMGRLKSIGNDLAYGRPVRDVFEFAAVFATAPEEKSLMGKFMAAAQKRFGKFA
ncbi:MAG: DUF6456 domain-containing protein [Bryobacteraceae bacterium]